MGGYDPPPTLHAFDFLATPFYVDVACAVILLIQVGILLVVVRARRQPWHGAALWRLLFALLALALALHQSDFYRRSCGGLSLTPTVLPAIGAPIGAIEGWQHRRGKGQA